MEGFRQPTPLRLNLGSGQQRLPGYVNVDKFGSPDLKWDLEKFPWPWDDSSVDEIILNHVLEHLGESTEVYFGIIKELYRVCKHGAIVDIVVPHPRHDDFLSDPTHVRAFTPQSFHQYSKSNCQAWQEMGAANTPLALYLDVDFTLGNVELQVDEPWFGELQAGRISQEQVEQAIRQFNNVCKQIKVRLTANKSDS
jgi:hypothetical protein